MPRWEDRRARPLRHGVHFRLTDSADNVLRRGPPGGLLGGMTELPGTQWRAASWDATEALAHAPMDVDRQAAGQVRHDFTHFELTIERFAARVARIEADGFHCAVSAPAHEALPWVNRRRHRSIARSDRTDADPRRASGRVCSCCLAPDPPVFEIHKDEPWIRRNPCQDWASE